MIEAICGFLAVILIFEVFIFLQLILIARRLRDLRGEEPDLKPIFMKKRHVKRPTELARDWLERRSGKKAG